jgi:hypothetical protein
MKGRRDIEFVLGLDHAAFTVPFTGQHHIGERAP